MRKWMLILLAAILVICTPAVFSEGEYVTVYQSNFSAGMDGWTGRGDAVLTQGLNWLHVEGRKSNWHSPGRDFTLIQGIPYKISVQVKQDSLDSAELMLSVAHSLDGRETYENLARVHVKREAWTTLSCTYTPGYYDKFVLYVETVDAPELAFDFRLFRLEAPAGTEAAQVEDTPAAAETPSLKEIYADSFDFGTALPGYAVNRGEIRDLVLKQFSILTPENEMKPDAMLDVAASRKLAEAGNETAAAVRLDACRALLDFASANGLKVHGHVLVWHSQTPEAFFHEGYDPAKPLVTRDVMLGRLENYIKAVFEAVEGRYPGLVVSWDVVNEAIDDGTNWLRQSNWVKTIGDDFVLKAFAFARRYAPEGVRLYYNDYNTAYSAKRRGILRLLESLIAEGNIDGYGFQMHHSVSTPSMQQIADSLKDVAALDLRIRVSELDVGADDASEQNLRRQAQKYAAIMKQLRKYADRIDTVQVWGVSDNMSWRSKNFPLLFDASLQPKPAFYAVADPDSVQ